MIIECTGCARKYSSRAPTCPGCGESTPEEFLEAPSADVDASAQDSAAPNTPEVPVGIGPERVVSSRSLLDKQRDAGSGKPPSKAPKIIGAVVAILFAVFLAIAVKGFFTVEEAKITVGNPRGADPEIVDLAKLMMGAHGFLDKRILLHAYFGDVGSTKGGYTIIEAFAPTTGELNLFVADKYVDDFSELERGDRFGIYGEVTATMKSFVFRAD